MHKTLFSFGMAILVMCSCATAEPAAEQPVRVLSSSDAPAPDATIDDLAWLEGHWKGSGLGGISEEIMSPAAGGQIMGMFRQSKADGTLQFYEFYHFAEQDGSLILRIKHFNPDMTGWEDKDESVEFPLVALEETAAYFDGLTFALVAPGQLRAGVMVDGQGQVDFAYSKVE